MERLGGTDRLLVTVARTKLWRMLDLEISQASERSGDCSLRNETVLAQSSSIDDAQSALFAWTFEFVRYGNADIDA